jgi:sugar phosphate isomerase/epimerase
MSTKPRSQQALNLITIKPASFKEKLQAAKGAGYGGVGLWADEIERCVHEGSSLGAIADLLRQTGLEAAEICAVAGWMGSQGEARQQAFERARSVFQLAQGVSCRVVITCAAFGPCPVEEAAGDFRELCRIAAKHNVLCALEFLGGVAQFHDVKSAWEVAEAADQPNGGLVVDTFHFYKGGSTLEQLEAVPTEKLFLVHINDARDLPRHELTDAHRVYPGLGAIPLNEILGLLRDKGYRGYYSLELFNPDYWQAEARLVAREGARALRKLGIE